MPIDPRLTPALRAEIAAWRDEGVVDAATAEKLLARYPPSEEGMSRALLAVYALGALLIGGGLISFVAWNWDGMGTTAKVLLVVGLLIGSHVGALRLRTSSWPRLGVGLTFLSTMIFGADIGLMAQIFNVNSNPYLGVGAWAAGALLAGFLLESRRSIDLAIALLFVWVDGMADDGRFRFFRSHDWTMPWLPFATTCAAGIVAWLSKSRVAPTLVLMGGGISYLLARGDGMWGGDRILMVRSFVLAASYATVPLLIKSGSRSGWRRPAWVLGFWAFVVPAYFLSFHDNDSYIREVWSRNAQFAGLAPLVAVIVVVLWKLPEAWWTREPLPALLIVGSFVLIGARLGNSSGMRTILANAVLVGLCAAMISVSVRETRRGLFWLGNFMAAVLIVSRFFEFDAELWLKALAFIGAGVAVIAVGVAFENRLRKRKVTNVA